MAEGRSITPEGQPHPVDSHKRDKWSTYVYPRVNTEIEWEEMLHKLCPTYKTSNLLALKPPKMTKTMPKSNKSTYCNYLNELSVSLQDDAPYTIEFLPKGDQPPLHHPTGTYCRPGIVAVRHYPASSRIDSKLLHWSHLDATGEEESTGKSIQAREARAGAYTTYNLQARPDLVSVPGIFVSESSFKLFFSNASRVYHTCAVEWSSDLAQKLLHAWMWRLYHPERDQSITIDMKTPLPTFTVISNKKAHDQPVVSRAGESIGRRTIVLTRFDPKDSDIVIKEQYIENSPRFKEGPILEKIHAAGHFPGVVRLDHHEYVKNGDQDISVESKLTTVKQVKTRLVLKDRGTRLADVETMRQLLKGIYDLLETSRILFRKRNILHRDISLENVLFHQKPVIPTESLRDDLDEMCFSEYLLKDPAGQGDSESGSDLRCRPTTRVIVIDFDCSEDQDPGKWSAGGPTARTGTPVFVARMVRFNEYPYGSYDLPPMPDVPSKLLGRYPEARIKAFPANKEESIKIPRKTVASAGFQHLLRYDAGEVSQGGNTPWVWSNLTGKDDARDANFIKSFPKPGFLHSSYTELEPLLESMSMHLQGDLSFSDDKERKGNQEYLHEVFQRLILEFLVANETKSFMDLKKEETPRGVEENPMDRSGTAWSSKRRFDEYAGIFGSSSNKSQRTE